MGKNHDADPKLSIGSLQRLPETVAGRGRCSGLAEAAVTVEATPIVKTPP